MDHVILNKHQLDQKIQRLAYQILEEHQDEKYLIIAGVKGKGYIFAGEINEYFKTISV